MLLAETALIPPRAAPELLPRATVLGVFLAELRAAAGFFAPAFRLGAGFFLELFLLELFLLEIFLVELFLVEPFVDEGRLEAFFFATPFLETRFDTFLAATFRGGVFFPDGRFLRLLVDIDFRDRAAAVFLRMPDFFWLLAAAFFAGMRFASKTVQMKSAIIHAQ